MATILEDGTRFVPVHPSQTLGMYDSFPFIANGVVYNSIYQRMLCSQALSVNDVKAFCAIRKLNDPDELQTYGRRLARHYPKEWDANAYKSCLDAVRAKFNGPCRHELMFHRQYRYEFAYIDPDVFWGTGASEVAARIGLPYRGKNMYGSILGIVRDELVDK